MFARSVSIRLKPNAVAEFIKLIETEVLPVLRKQKGFQDKITLVDPTGRDALGISLWDQKANADAYAKTGYPEAIKNLNKVVEGTPKVQTYEVASSTLHKLAAPVAV
jgi:quinol monooxygenase YgiN